VVYELQSRPTGAVTNPVGELRRSLGLGFRKQGATLRRFQRYVAASRLEGPLTQDMALAFSLASSGTGNGRECRYGVIRRFSEYLAIFDPRTQRLEPRVLPRSRAIPPPRILSGAELAALISACARITPDRPYRGRTLAMAIGLLASTGLRSGEALRFDRADVDLSTGVLHVRKTEVPQGSPGPGPSDHAGRAAKVCALTRHHLSSTEVSSLFS